MLLRILTLFAVLAAALAPAQQAVAISDELHTKFSELKAAEEKKDAELVQKLAVELSQAARVVIKTPVPADETDAAALKSKVDFAKQVESYADYALYVQALRAPTAEKRIELFDVLNAQSPGSEYVPQLYSIYAASMAQTGQSNKLFAFAEKAIGRDGSNEDILAILADGAMARKQYDRAAGYGVKLATVMAGHNRPEGMAAADWDRKKSLMTGRGYWIAGISYATVAKYPQADKNLRAALPFVKGDDQMAGPALFFLGVANYNLARATQSKALLREAMAFSEQAAAIKGPYSQQAYTNANSMRQELMRMR